MAVSSGSASPWRPPVNKAVSDHMRQMQRRSAVARWIGLSAADRRSKMSALSKARWAKRPKTKGYRLASNAEVSDPATR